MNRIQALRLEKAKLAPSAFSQEALARRLGVSARTVARWEAGESKPRKRHARALARELGVDVDDLGLEGGRVED
ncbi:MAG TPA: helix-turn-helix transcriptional regulator [Gemmataceae bacterium]|nr:helix-turn-helix transcriptional regulator [Gemmataceae bacterium]